MAEAGNHDRYLCVISTCSWYYERPSGPTAAELERALLVGAEEASRDRAMGTDGILREHFETHTLEQWVTALVEQRRRAETAERELTELRERIGEAGTEWSVRWHEDGAVSEKRHTEAEARERGDANPKTMAAVSRIVGEWKAADGG